MLGDGFKDGLIAAADGFTGVTATDTDNGKQDKIQARAEELQDAMVAALTAGDGKKFNELYNTWKSDNLLSPVALKTENGEFRKENSEIIHISGPDGKPLVVKNIKLQGTFEQLDLNVEFVDSDLTNVKFRKSDIDVTLTNCNVNKLFIANSNVINLTGSNDPSSKKTYSGLQLQDNVIGDINLEVKFAPDNDGNHSYIQGNKEGNVKIVALQDTDHKLDISSGNELRVSLNKGMTASISSKVVAPEVQPEAEQDKPQQTEAASNVKYYGRIQFEEGKKDVSASTKIIIMTVDKNGQMIEKTSTVGEEVQNLINDVRKASSTNPDYQIHYTAGASEKGSDAANKTLTEQRGRNLATVIQDLLPADIKSHMVADLTAYGETHATGNQEKDQYADFVLVKNPKLLQQVAVSKPAPAAPQVKNYDEDFAKNNDAALPASYSRELEIAKNRSYKEFTLEELEERTKPNEYEIGNQKVSKHILCPTVLKNQNMRSCKTFT